ncbi:MAG: Tryptophan halogenase [Rhodospirillales bacterium]|nr:Tryptophan halogenase [Rhodospirillales bacterium]
MAETMRSIAILGGGSAGWMTALYLQTALAATGRAKIAIELVESEDIGIIGVGEATVPTLRGTLAVMGIPEAEFLVRANATFKNGIKFQDWKEPGNAFMHPFEPPSLSDGFSIAQHWVNVRNNGGNVKQFDRAVVLTPALCDAGGSPKVWSSQPYDAPIPYAYHLDAVKFAAYMQELAVSRGVKRTAGTVVDVTLAEDGSISSLQTKEGATIRADLFIDCSGFASGLIEKTLKDPFVPYDDLLCDRAVAFQVPFTDAKHRIRPYTTSAAKPAGWIWEIDLFDRMGTGYVYSSAFISDEKAEEELCRHHGVDRKTVTPRRLPMRVGRRTNSWVKNCVAIGLSSGFIEPLESTGIYLIESSIKLLIDHIGYQRPVDALVSRYNELMRTTYDDIRDFIVAHYVTSPRRDTPFWRAYTNDVKISDRLAAHLELWRHRVPMGSDIHSPLVLFNNNNYTFILAGMDLLPKATPYDAIMDVARSEALLSRMRQIQTSAMTMHADHRDYLIKVRGSFGGASAPFVAAR